MEKVRNFDNFKVAIDMDVPCALELSSDLVFMFDGRKFTINDIRFGPNELTALRDALGVATLKVC